MIYDHARSMITENKENGDSNSMSNRTRNRHVWRTVAINSVDLDRGIRFIDNQLMVLVLTPPWWVPGVVASVGVVFLPQAFCTYRS